MTSAILLAKLCQLLPCLILYPKAKLACYSMYLLTSYFCIPGPSDERTSYFAVTSRRSCESESEVVQSCPILCNPMDCSLPHSSIHGIFQAKVLEWLPFPSPEDLTQGLNLGLPHCRQTLYHLSHLASPQVLQVFIKPFNFSIFGISAWGRDLDYCDIEWLPWKQTETFCPFCIQDSFVDYEGTPLLLRDSCPQQQI